MAHVKDHSKVKPTRIQTSVQEENKMYMIVSIFPNNIE